MVALLSSAWAFRAPKTERALEEYLIYERVHHQIALDLGLAWPTQDEPYPGPLGQHINAGGATEMGMEISGPSAS